MVLGEYNLYVKIGTSYHKKRRGKIALFSTSILSAAVLFLAFIPVNTTPNIDVTNGKGNIPTKITKGMVTLNGGWLFYPETVLDPGRIAPSPVLEQWKPRLLAIELIMFGSLLLLGIFLNFLNFAGIPGPLFIKTCFSDREDLFRLSTNIICVFLIILTIVSICVPFPVMYRLAIPFYPLIVFITVTLAVDFGKANRHLNAA